MVTRDLKIYTTPKRLREIADTLEKEFSQVYVGQDLPKVYLCEDRDMHQVIYLTIDQDKIKEK